MAVVKKNFAEKIMEFISYGTIFWFFSFFVSLVLLGTEYEIVTIFLFFCGLIPASGYFIIPLIYPSLKEQEVKRIIGKVKSEYEPIIREEFTVHDSDAKSVYLKCVKWLESKGAKIYEENYEDYILAFHEVYDKQHGAGGASIGSSNKPENLPKFFHMRLLQEGQAVNVILEILPGWQVHPIDGYKNRKYAWEVLSHQLKYYLQS